ncbi:hypothetical protein F4810DRAFT_254888 [Camillea tinctor]|nr:hypothetical protein F4810DRAFT_254888 [Camillea tinctor]
MDSYIPLQLPYFAPEDQLPAPLPTFEQIFSSKRVFHSRLDKGRVVQVGDHFVAKFGTDSEIIECESLLFIKKNDASIPVPSVYAAYEHEHGGVLYNVLIMEYVSGYSLISVDHLGYLTGEKEAIVSQLQACFNKLRHLPCPRYFGALGRRPYGKKAYGGPFDTAKAASDAVYRDLVRDLNSCLFQGDEKLFQQYREMYEAARSQFGDYGKHSKPVFTHGNLRWENIIVRPDSTICIINWGQAGFFPEHCEYLSATLMNIPIRHRLSNHREWIEMVPGFLDSYESKAKLIDFIRCEYTRKGRFWDSTRAGNHDNSDNEFPGYDSGDDLLDDDGDYADLDDYDVVHDSEICR